MDGSIRAICRLAYPALRELLSGAESPGLTPDRTVPPALGPERSGRILGPVPNRIRSYDREIGRRAPRRAGERGVETCGAMGMLTGRGARHVQVDRDRDLWLVRIV